MILLPPEKILQTAGIIYSVILHEKPPASVLDAAFARHQQPGQVIRTLVFRKEMNDFLIVLAPGDMQVSWQKLRNAFQIRRITTATRDEVLRVTGYKPGTVSPLGLPVILPIFIEQSIVLNTEISIGSGHESRALILQTQDLLSLLSNAILLDLRA